MEMIPHQSVPVHDPSHVAAARAQVRAAAIRAGFDDTDAHRAGLVATELATNLAKHTRAGGEILLTVCDQPSAALELIAIDRGPGIPDVAAALVDGHSTAGSPGTGLGAIRRLSQDFDLYSDASGTVIWCHVRGRGAGAPEPGSFDVAGITVAMSGEDVSGDAWVVRRRADGIVALVADGLGHGPFAAEASAAAVDAFRRRTFPDAATALQAVHDALRPTRGAAGAVIDLRARGRHVVFTGIGNIGAAIVQQGTTRQAVSLAGILGHQARQFREYTYPWSQDALLVAHSDGLSSHWSLDAYPGLRQRRPAVIAAVLYRDFSRGRDDVTVLVAREAA
jgi:anti-sigma regulatory factor (Ser/Thr protein kinase)